MLGRFHAQVLADAFGLYGGEGAGALNGGSGGRAGVTMAQGF